VEVYYRRRGSCIEEIHKIETPVDLAMSAPKIAVQLPISGTT
jgi:hypothetical protein